MNIAGPFTFSADIGFAKNHVLATVSADSVYANGLYVNKDAIQVDPGASWKAQLARNNLPNATQFIESVIRLGNDFYGSNGAGWYQFVRGKVDTQAPTDFNALTAAGRMWISAFSGWTNGPADLSSQSGAAIVEVIEVSSGYLAQEIKQYGGTYRRSRNCQAGSWSSWA